MYIIKEQNVAVIGYWFDRHTRSWVVQLLDEYENQIGEASYCGSRQQMESEIEYLTDKYHVEVVRR